MNPRKQPLEIKVVDGVMSISIGVEQLATAVEWCPSNCKWDNDGNYIKPVISDPDAFAASIVYCLQDEEEDGTTPVTDMIDEAAERALERAMEGIAPFDFPEPEGWEVAEVGQPTSGGEAG